VRLVLEENQVEGRGCANESELFSISDQNPLPVGLVIGLPIKTAL
jgi:hypothetical protein